jgi:hypothetical protein
MTPAAEARVMNRLWQLQLFTWCLEASMVDDTFRTRCRHVCEAGAVLSDVADEYRGTPSMSNIVHDVLSKPPREWKQTWCRPELFGQGLQEAFK